MKRVIANLIVLLGAASFGILSTIVKLGYLRGFSTAEITSSQILFGCIILWLLTIPALHQLRTVPLMAIGKLLLSGIFAGFTGIFYYLALQTINASFGIILLFQFVWMGFLVDWFFQRRPPTRQQWLAILVVLIGTVLAAGYQALKIQSLNGMGILFGLLAAASYTGNLNVNGRVALDVPPILRSTLMMTGATILTMIVFPPQFLFNGSLNHGLWPFAIMLALFGVVIPPFLYARGIPVVGPAMASILGSAELPVVIICSALVLKETIDGLQWVGVALILLGIVVSQYHVFDLKRFRQHIA